VEVFGNEPYINMTDECVREKLDGCDSLHKHPGAVITESFVNTVKSRFDENVMEGRIEIIYEIARQIYDKHTITRHAIVDITKQKKIFYFLKQHKERMMSIILKRFTKK